MTRLATLTPDTRRRSGLAIALDHFKDARPDYYEQAIDHLDNPDVSATDLARALTGDARDDNVEVKVTEKSVRDYREALRLYRGDM